jgi:hypothetical protein
MRALSKARRLQAESASAESLETVRKLHALTALRADGGD